MLSVCPRVIRNREKPADLTRFTVTDQPLLAAFLLALGVFSFGRFLLKTTLVFLQTFVLSGTDVSTASSQRVMSSTDRETRW